MALYDNRSLALERDSSKYPRKILAPITERLRSMFHEGEARDTQADARRLAPDGRSDAETEEGQLVLRFPLVRRGYDQVAVDKYVADLERELAALDRELAELRGHSGTSDEVANEIKRIGEQTSSVLMAAHQQREEILSTARSEAERCVAEATAVARTVTEQSEARLRELEAQNEAARSERAQLLGDIRRISAALAAVADSAVD